MLVRPISVVVTVLAVAVLGGCSASGGSDDLDRIDGPAEVDPDYDPLGQTTTPDPGSG